MRWYRKYSLASRKDRLMNFKELLEKVKEQDIDKPVDELVELINTAAIYGDINRKETSSLLTALSGRLKE